MRVLVVGGGIVGASAAYHLTGAGADVVLVDRGEPGQATAAGAGVVFPYPLAAEHTGWAALVPGTLDHWAAVVDPLGADAGVAATDVVYVDDAGGAEVRDGLTQLRELAGAPGFPAAGDFRWLDSAELTARVPVLRTGLRGIMSPGGRRADGRLLTERLLSDARARGAHHRHGNAALDVRGGRVAATVDGEPVDADAVVVAAGAWSARICEPLGVCLPVRPVRGQILHLDASVQGTEEWPIVRRLNHHYLLGFPGGRVVSGALHEPEAGFELRSTATGVAQLLSWALGTAPGLAGSTFAEVRVGFRPGGTDGLPVLGRVGRHPDVVVATGLGAHGLTFGPYLGAVAADLAVGREPAVDLTAFHPNRGHPR